MKLTSRLVVAFALPFLLVACGDKSSTGPGGNGAGSVTATVDGKQFKASGVGVVGTYVMDNVLNISATDWSSGTRQIIINAYNVKGTGTYNLGGANISSGAYSEGQSINDVNSWVSNVPRGSGSLVITQLDATGAKGTFSFTGLGGEDGSLGTKVITKGEFDVKFMGVGFP